LFNFDKAPVSAEAIKAAVEKRKAGEEEARALVFADDYAACQKTVEAGKRRLKALRKAADEFAAEFKKLEAAESPKGFTDILSSLQIRYEIGVPTLRGDYEE